MQQQVMLLEDLDKSFFESVGRKGANLGEMAGAGFRVPTGFCLTMDAYRQFMEETGAYEQLAPLIDELDERKLDIQFIDQVGTMMREFIQKQPIRHDFEVAVLSNYRRISEKHKVANLPVAVRSSGAVSMPGSYDTHLNVIGEQMVLDKIKAVWASTFNTRSIMARLNKGGSVSDSPIGVVVLGMVNAKSAGVALSMNPVTRDSSEIIIESSWGLGEIVVSGQGAVDRFVVDKESLSFKEKVLAPKTRMIISGSQGVSITDIPMDLQSSASIQDDEVSELVRVAKELEAHFGQPQDIEWAITADQQLPDSIIILQSRPAK